MGEQAVKPVLESLLFVSEEPIRLEILTRILPEWKEEEIGEGIRQIQVESEDPTRGVELVQVAGGYQFRTKPIWAEWVNRLKKVKVVKFSRAALETLAIVAYRQPIIRSEIEQIRGVDSGWTLRILLEKGMIRMMGRKDLPGRPILYGSTQAFLELFGLNALSDLPTLKEVLPPPKEEETLKSEEAREMETATEDGLSPPEEVVE